jgi:hypothetical protein
LCIQACGNAYLDLTKVKNVGIVHGMNYTPRKVFEDFHTANWHRAILLCHRRCGKTFASVAEKLKRAYNGPQDGQYLFISPLAEQSMANTIGMFARFDNGEGYITKVDKTAGVLSLANGAQITLGGARTAEKYRGRYLDGCFDYNTEVLTEFGWMKIGDVVTKNRQIKLAQFNQESHAVSFAYPTKYFEFLDRETMNVDFGKLTGDVTCTPNHEFLVRDGRRNIWKKVTADKLNNHMVWHASGKQLVHEKLAPIQKLAIALQVDGCLKYTTDYHRKHATAAWVISIKKERKIKRLDNILSQVDGIKYTKSVGNKRKYAVYNITTPANITKKLTTFFSLESLINKAEDFVKEVAEWDGYKYPTGLYYSSTDKDNRDFVQAVAFMAGYIATTGVQVDNRSDKYNDVYRLFMHKKDEVQIKIDSKEYNSQKQTVYCVEMPEHTMVVRGRRPIITGNCIVDEISQVPPEIIAEVILPCLADRNGWLAFLGTARVDDDYRLYKLYKEYKDDPNWFVKKISVYDNPEAFPPERIKEIHDEHIKFCLASGMSMTQAEQSFNVEFECDFSFIDEGRPNMTALFYPELQSLFDAKPPRLLEPTDTTVVNIPSATKTAVFDISHSAGRDYTVATIVAETTTTPIVTNIIWENNQPLQYWFDYLRQQGIRNVALPFDAATINKETMLSLVQTFKREGFNVVRIKRLLREEQVENGRWLLNNARFSKDCIPGLSQIGLFQEFSNRHGLPQDVVASLLYAGQVLRKKHVKIELANAIKTRYNNNMDLYDNHVSYYGDIITGE